MDKGHIGGQMVQYIKEAFEMAYFMEKECGNLSKMTAMKASTGIIKSMDKELTGGATA